MAFTAKFGDGSAKPTDDTWSDATTKALREAGFRIIRFGSTGVTYVGQTNPKRMPHGHGYMYQPSGDLHAGSFADGRAHGPGVYVGANGAESTGQWDQNRRAGVFHVVDKDGVHWTENYGPDGKRTLRKKDRHTAPNPAFVLGASSSSGGTPQPETIEVEDDTDVAGEQCWNCSGISRARNNHQWACRMHSGAWAEDRTYRGDGQPPGIWACCGRESRAEPGCSFQAHNYRQSK